MKPTVSAYLTVWEYRQGYNLSDSRKASIGKCYSVRDTGKT